MSFDPDNSRRRTIYLPLRRSNLPSLLNLFDFGDATTTGEGRASTNVAPQALFMMNSKFAAERARGLAKYLVADTDSDEKTRVERAYLITLGVKPGADEVKAALEYVSRYPQAPPAAAWESFCHILLA